MTSTSSDFLLIGKSGVGKTATSNSILRKNEPNISPGPFKPIVLRTQTKYGSTFSAVDGLNMIEVRETADFTEVKNILADVDGISAFLIIMQFGERYTEADWDVILATKAVFGEDVLSRFGICVFTNGDKFKRLVESGNENFKTIEEWLGEQSGKMREVYEDCQRRVVLFDNKTKVEKEKQKQMEHFFQNVVLIEKFPTSKYTLSEFEDFDGKDKLIQRKRQKDMAADTLEKIRDFRHRFKELSKGDVDIQDLIALEEDLKSLKQELEKLFSAESDIIVPVQALLIEVQAVIGCENNKIKSSSENKYINGQPGVNTASQNEEFITIQLSKQLLSELEEAMANVMKLNEDLIKKEQAAIELKKEIESTVKQLQSGFIDLQSKLKEAGEKAKLFHEEALPAEKRTKKNLKSDQGQSGSCNLQ